MPTSVCGYQDAVSSNSVTCAGGYPYCGFNTQYAVAGCCAQTVAGDASAVTSCAFYERCYDYGQLLLPVDTSTLYW